MQSPDRQNRFSRQNEIDNTPFFAQPLPKNLNAIVITYCFRPLGIVMGLMATEFDERGWGQKCLCCMERIGHDDYFSEIHKKSISVNSYDPLEPGGYFQPSAYAFMHYICDSCNFLSSSNWFIPTDYRGDDRYKSRVNDRHTRRSLNPRRRISFRDSMQCPITKLLLTLKA